MKLLTEVLEFNELTRIRILFGEKGIPIFVGNENSAKNFGFVYPARKYAIFVVYDQQYPDAVSLLENENHEVLVEVNVEEHEKILESSGYEINKHILISFIKYSSIFITVSLSIIFFLTKK